MEKRLTALIEPKPKERPRGTIIDGHVRIYTPKTTEAYEKQVRTAWVKENGETPIEGPVVVRVHLGMKIPKGTTKAKKALMLARKERPTVKPDADNCAKSVLDALNGVAYRDDNQIVDLIVRKFYTEIPCVKVIVSDWVPKEEGA